jgi:hypothetical protein
MYLMENNGNLTIILESNPVVYQFDVIGCQYDPCGRYDVLVVSLFSINET